MANSKDGTTWVVGDVHGCAHELEALLHQLEDRGAGTILSVGDLFHRGPEPLGVLDLCREFEVRFILGNHEHAVLARTGLAPGRADGGDRPPRRTEFPPLAADDLCGDGRRPFRAGSERLEEVLLFLQEHDGYYLATQALAGAHPGAYLAPRPGPQADWCVVHAGRPPGASLSSVGPAELHSLRRYGPGRRFWFDLHTGPELVLYGHVPHPEPKRHLAAGRLVALGLDTGCVYGGSLTAYSPELDEFCSVPARERYATR